MIAPFGSFTEPATVPPGDDWADTDNVRNNTHAASKAIDLIKRVVGHLSN